MPTAIDVLAHKPGQRCTIRYAFDDRELVGKVYRRTVLAERVAGWIDAVGEPEPLAVVADLGLLVRPYVTGRDLRHALDGPAVEAAARRIAALHAAAPPPAVRAKPLAHELEKLDRWCDEVGVTASPRSALHALADGLAAVPATLIHRDFYYANVLWDGARVWLLDFDELGIGDPAFDVGHFLAHLEVLAYRTTGRFDANADAARRFLAACPPLDPEHVRFYRAYTFMKLAATEVRRRRPGWRDQTVAFVRRAAAEL
jgi:aminoglycoside phosphotransferase (APT) family kinase protein